MGKRAAGKEFVARAVENRSTIRVVEQPLRKVGSGSHVFQTLLVLNPDRVASKLARDAHSRDVHLALFQDLSVREVGVRVRASDESHATLVEPRTHLLRLFIRN